MINESAILLPELKSEKFASCKYSCRVRKKGKKENMFQLKKTKQKKEPTKKPP